MTLLPTLVGSPRFAAPSRTRGGSCDTTAARGKDLGERCRNTRKSVVAACTVDPRLPVANRHGGTPQLLEAQPPISEPEASRAEQTSWPRAAPGTVGGETLGG